MFALVTVLAVAGVFLFGRERETWLEHEKRRLFRVAALGQRVAGIVLAGALEAEDLAEFAPAVVERAVKLYRRESAYFPTVADIRARYDELRRGLAARVEALPKSTRTLDEQMALNGEWCAKILALRDKMDARKQGRPDTARSTLSF